MKGALTLWANLEAARDGFLWVFFIFIALFQNASPGEGRNQPVENEAETEQAKKDEKRVNPLQ